MNVLAIIPFSVPSTIINVEYPLLALAQTEEITTTIRLEYEVTPQDVAHADVIVLCRNTEPVFRPVFDLAAELGIPLIYVLDDDIKGAPEGSQSYRYHREPSRMAFYEWLLRRAALVRIHSPAIRNLIEPYNTSISQVWTSVDWSLVPENLPILDTKHVKMVYAAQRESGQLLFDLMRNDLHALMKKYPDQLELHFLGYNPPDFSNYPNVVQVPLEYNYEAFFRSFTRAGYAIGLAPMLDTQFFRCKTDVKFREYAAAGAVGIYMASELYSSSVRHEETGLLVNGDEGTWFAAVEYLLHNRDVLQRLRTSAKDAVYRKYHMDVVGPMWMADIAKLPQRIPLTGETEAKIRLLKWRFPNPHHTLKARTRQFISRLLPQSTKRRLISRLRS